MSTINIKTVIKKPNRNANIGTLYLRLKLHLSNGKREIIEISTRNSIKLNQWKGGIEPVKGSNSDALRMNDSTRRYISAIYSIFEDYKTSKIFSVEVFKSKILRQLFGIERVDTDSTLHITDLFTRYVTNYGAKMSRSRISRYEFVSRLIKEFCKHEYGVEKYPIIDIDRDFHVKFESYLFRINKDYSQETVNNYLKILGAVVRDAYHSSLIEKFPFVNRPYKYSETSVRHLTSDELQKIRNFKSSDERLQTVADAFLFAANTGLSHTDLLTLSKEHLISEKGSLYIRKKREKSNVLCTIPVNNEALAIIKKYEHYSDLTGKILPIFCINDYNDLLKRIADKCCINIDLSSHVARHTFSTTVWLDNGGSIEVLQKMLGHKSIRTTQRYGRVNERRIIQEAEKIFNTI